MRPFSSKLLRTVAAILDALTHALLEKDVHDRFRALQAMIRVGGFARSFVGPFSFSAETNYNDQFGHESSHSKTAIAHHRYSRVVREAATGTRCGLLANYDGLQGIGADYA